MSKKLKTYTLYAIREVGEVAVIQAKSKDDALEKVDNKDWEVDTDLDWQITSVREEGEPAGGQWEGGL
tara:strand:+ start:252 stop:455 length:204 start_codon:yes stop_codon:yes gene_type:complete